MTKFVVRAVVFLFFLIACNYAFAGDGVAYTPHGSYTSSDGHTHTTYVQDTQNSEVMTNSYVLQAAVI